MLIKQIPSDFFRKGDNVRGIIESVELKGNKPQIIMSRTSELFLEKLFEQENDFKEVIKKREIYQVLEIATDKIEDVSNVIESIIIKYA